VPTGGRDALKTVNAIDQMHQEPFSRLARSIPSDELPINGILRRLCVARDLEGDGVFRV
jgi:hypothetical protein